MNFYKCLERQIFELEGYSIAPVRFEDRFEIMRWRNAQLNVLRQAKPLTEADQEKYFQTTVKALFEAEQPGQLLFSFFKGDQLIGYGGLVHINWQDQRGEVSFLLDERLVLDPPDYEHEFSIFLSLMKEVAFRELGFNRLCTETYDIRPYHIGIMERNGFVLEGRMKEHVKIDGKFCDSLIHGCLKENWHV